MSEKSEYIERGALSKFVRDVRKRLPKDSKDFFTRDEMLLNFQQYVDAQPAADVEPVVRGEWKLVYKEAPALFECSVCGNRELYADSEFDFCPSCGSVMTEAGRKKIAERSGSGE